MTTDAVPGRLRAILRELEAATDEYDDRKKEFEIARVKYEVARERFAKTKEMARSMMGYRDWGQWQADNPDVKFSGTQLGNAIIEILSSTAWKAAEAFTENKSNAFQPSVSLESIARELEEGGYEFKSIAPMREANAALIKLKGVTKNTWNWYFANDADEILKIFEGALEPGEEEN